MYVISCAETCSVKSDNYVPLIIVCAIYGFFAFSLLPIALELSVECKPINIYIYIYMYTP